MRPRAPPAAAAGLRHPRDRAGQVYIERHSSGLLAGSFLEWLPQAYVGIYPSGSLSWDHLWFVGYVLILTFVLLPVYLWARTPSGQAARARLAVVMGATGLHWLMAVPLAASITFLSPISHNVNGFVGDWHGIATAALRPLLCGGFVYGTPQMLATLNRQRWVSLAIAVSAFVAFDLLVFHAAPGVQVRVLGVPAYLPTVLSTFGVTWLICAGGVRPWPWVRPLFGLKPLTPRPAALPASTTGL